MPQSFDKNTTKLFLIVVLSIPIFSAGCINLAANLIHAINGNERPAEFDGLKGKRVAVVVSSDSAMGNNQVSTILSSYIQATLQSNVEEIDVVPGSEVDNWMDSNALSDAEYHEVGKGVKADRLLAVDVLNLRIKDGATLYRGQADVTVTVYDIPSGGRVVYRKNIPEFAFPEHAGTPITDTSESKFRSIFLTLVANEVSGLFYPVDPTLSVARDATASRL